MGLYLHNNYWQKLSESALTELWSLAKNLIRRKHNEERICCIAIRDHCGILNCLLFVPHSPDCWECELLDCIAVARGSNADSSFSKLRLGVWTCPVTPWGIKARVTFGNLLKTLSKTTGYSSLEQAIERLKLLGRKSLEKEVGGE